MERCSSQTEEISGLLPMKRNKGSEKNDKQKKTKTNWQNVEPSECPASYIPD